MARRLIAGLVIGATCAATAAYAAPPQRVGPDLRLPARVATAPERIPEPPEPPAWTPALRWTGLALALSGLAVTAIGVGMGVDARSTVDSTQRSEGVSQVEYAERYQAAAAQMDLANILLASGGSTTGVGAALFVFDLLAAPDPPDADVRIERVVVRETVEAELFVVQGVVIERSSGEPVLKARVRIGDSANFLLTDSRDGSFSIEVRGGNGALPIVAEAPGYQPARVVVPLSESGVSDPVRIELVSTRETLGVTVRGTVKNGRTGAPLRARVFVPKENRKTRAADNGAFTLDLANAGVVDVLLSAPGFVTQKKRLRVEPGDNVVLNVDLEPAR